MANRMRELDDLTVPELAALYEQRFDKRPRVRHKRWLLKRIAWKEQEQRLGGLSKVAKRRLEELIAEIDIPLNEPPTRLRRAAASGPLPGTTLVRQWRGQEIRVDIREDGVEHDGTVYRTLTAAAKAITGQHLSGPAFFGVAERRRA